LVKNTQKKTRLSVAIVLPFMSFMLVGTQPFNGHPHLNKKLNMKRACKILTSNNMRISTCEFHTTIKKQIIHV